jgi:hypothetical protein
MLDQACLNRCRGTVRPFYQVVQDARQVAENLPEPDTAAASALRMRLSTLSIELGGMCRRCAERLVILVEVRPLSPKDTKGGTPHGQC